MSWIVQNLWNNRERIKNKSRGLEPREYRNFNFYLNYDLVYIGGDEENDGIIQNEEFLKEFGYDDPFIENDEYNDLLMIEKAIQELIELGLLSEGDIQLLNKSGEGLYTDENRTRKTDALKFYSICDRIAYYMGGYFTDEGYIHYIANKHKLNEEQTQLLRLYIKSNFKNKILSRGYKKKELKNEETISNQM